MINVRVPASRLRWLVSELERVGEKFYVGELRGGYYSVQVNPSAEKITNKVLDYKRKAPAWDKGWHWTQITGNIITGIWLISAVLLFPVASWLTVFFVIGALVKFFADMEWAWGDAYLLSSGDKRVSPIEKIKVFVLFAVGSCVMLALPVFSVLHYVIGV